MKTKFSILLFFISFNCLAQNWFPNGATWHYGVRENPFGGPEQGYLKVESVMDSVFMGKNCKVLQKTFFSSLNGDTIDQGIEILYSDSDKVYEYIYGKFYMLYDFSAHVGDTLKIKEPYFTGNSPDTTFKIVVDSIGVEIINADTLRVQYISGPRYWHFGKKIIEKIGGALYLFPQNDFDFDSGEGKELRCYNDTKISYKASYLPCDALITNVGEINTIEDNVSIYPNPFNHLIKIQIDQKLLDLKTNSLVIYNTMGQILYEKNDFQSPITEINLDSLQQGIYFIKIYFNNYSLNKKIIKY